MARLPRNLPTLLRNAGLTVVVLPNWLNTGHDGVFDAEGVLDHHTGSYDSLTDADNDYDYAIWLQRIGRKDLAAPLCNIALSAEGVVYLCAAGKAYHAGKAKPVGTMAGGDGNRLYIGIEAMNDGTQGWGEKQYKAYVTLNAVLTRSVTKNSVSTVRGHKETSITGKWDPGKMDMDKMRRDVKAKIAELNSPIRPRTITSDLRIATANVKSNPLMPLSKVEADYDKILKAALSKGVMKITICEHHKTYTATLRKVAKKYGFVVVTNNANAVLTYGTKWGPLNIANTLLAKGISRLFPNTNILRVRDKTPAGTPVVTNASHFAVGWTNPKNPNYAKLHTLGLAAVAGTRKLVSGQLKAEGGTAVLLGLDANTTKKIDFDVPNSKEAWMVPAGGTPMRKMMQSYCWVPENWSVVLKEGGVLVSTDVLNTDHDVVYAHYQVTRPVK